MGGVQGFLGCGFGFGVGTERFIFSLPLSDLIQNQKRKILRAEERGVQRREEVFRAMSPEKETAPAP